MRLPRILFAILLPAAGAMAQEAPTPSVQGTLAGHSNHGEAFNEGPRQRAYLMKNTGKVDFPITTKFPMAQKFFTQGVGQLHGFWYFEAERSFRQSAAIDPDCAMAYWGMAMANVGNDKRAKEFIANAVKRESSSTPHEKMWIDGLSAYYKGEPKDLQARRKEYLATLEKIMTAYPTDLEAKVFFALQSWENNFGLSKEAREKIEKLLNEVLAANPNHPCHHYRIHLWNYNDDSKALNSAALCGQSAAGIAHMWHMPGHTYSGLKRYSDAAWQQEASARTDHAQMMRDHVLPDQIHNYAHNNEWLIRDLMNIGRVHDALDLAKNMTELPRHPKFNDLNTGGSASEGRQRMLDVLIKYELWDETLRLANTVYLEPTDKPIHQAARLHAMGLAYFGKGDARNGAAQITALEAIIRDQRAKQNAEKDKAADEARKKNESEEKIKSARDSAGSYMNYDIENMIHLPEELQILQAVAAGKNSEAAKLMEKMHGFPKVRQAQVYLAIGNQEKALSVAKMMADNSKNEVQPLANCVDILHRCGKEQEAIARFHDLQQISGEIDLDAPVFQRLAPIAKSLNLSSDWRTPAAAKTDVGVRPPLDTLGPFRWQPTPAAQWSLRDANGKRVSLKDYKGKPVVVFFFLGHGCAHCIEQLSLFAPIAPEFQKAGISMVAISMDSPEGIRKTFPNGGEGTFPFPLLSDGKVEVFKAYRAYDDFEKMPLHGTFLIDERGLVRWQDISYEPFRETAFLLAESKRLLKQETIRKSASIKGTSAH